MARIYQTGFELPGATPNSSLTTNSGTAPGWIGTNFTNAGMPGFNTSYSSVSGFSVSNDGFAIIKSDSLSHKSVAGLGGSTWLRARYLNSAGAGRIAGFVLPYSIYDGYISFAVKPNLDSLNSFSFAPLYSAGNLTTSSTMTTLAGGFEHSAGYMKGLAANRSALASPAPVALQLDSTVWHWVTFEFKNGVGTKIYVSTAGSSAVLETTGLSSPVSGFAFYTYRVSGSNHEYLIDDIVVHTPSVSFINCSSTSSLPSGVITGSDSGATGTISNVEFSDSTYGVANAGRLIIYGVSGQFTDGEQISSAAGWTATVKLTGGGENGLDFNSGKPGQTYMLGLALNGDRSGSIEMTGSDGNQTDNYLLLNKSVLNDSTYVQAIGASTAMDLYDLSDISQSITGITGISMVTRVKKAGDINTLIPAIKIGDNVQYSNSIDITGNLSYAQKYKVIDINSSTNESFTKAQIDGAAVGLRFK